MPIEAVDAVDLKKGDVLENGVRVLDAYNCGAGRWIELSDGHTGMITRGEASYRVQR